MYALNINCRRVLLALFCKLTLVWQYYGTLLCEQFLVIIRSDVDNFFFITPTILMCPPFSAQYIFFNLFKFFVKIGFEVKNMCRFAPIFNVEQVVVLTMTRISE